MNLLKETVEDITRSGHTPSDIIFIGSERSGHQCTWDEFQHLANVEYDSGYGAQEVASDLVIVFRDGAKMWRGEYDGSEQWEFSEPFKTPLERKTITRLIVPPDLVGWCDLAECNTDPTDAGQKP